jgi:hypothetical protein
LYALQPLGLLPELDHQNAFLLITALQAISRVLKIERLTCHYLVVTGQHPPKCKVNLQTSRQNKLYQIPELVRRTHVT